MRIKAGFHGLIPVFLLTLALASHAHAYTELHIQKNMYPKKEPDVISDTVTRTAKPGPVPVLLIIHHSDIFPVELKGVVISAEFEGGTAPTSKEIQYGLRLKQLSWHDLQYADIPPGYTGAATISVTFNMKARGGDELTIRNNNLRGLKHAPMKVLVGAPPLPREDGWLYGDTHIHTLYTENQVEFGSPLPVTAEMADAFGLDWLAFTDHSFDLDDVEGDTVKNDPELKKWGKMLADVAEARRKHPGVTFLPGEELSCGSAEEKNVHMIVLNTEKFHVGNGDGHENGNQPDLPCAKVTAELPDTAAAFAAHPITDISAVEIYLIKRGNWSLDDMSAPGLTGLEAWNHDQHPKKEGFDAWVKLLLEGKRKYLVGGTDAHGDFSIEPGNAGYEDVSQLPFGNIRTAVYLPGVKKPSAEQVIAALRAGRAIATSGPFANIMLKNSKGASAGIGGDISGGPIAADVEALSSSEFGPVAKVRVLLGGIGAPEEKVIAEFTDKDISGGMKAMKTVAVPGDVKTGYVRVEAYSQLDGVTFDAYTNPVWFKQ
jgi:hypothetical protein